MYSDAMTLTHSEHLLIVSGAFENRLREVETVISGNLTRCAVNVPLVGHVGVLWSALTLSEIMA
jgi:hypothetical protein